MDNLQTELQELQNLDPSALDDAQKTRLSELPLLIVQEEKTSLLAELEKKEKDLSSALSQKEHWRKKAEEVKPNQTEGVDSIDLIKLGKKLQDYSDEELDFVTKFAGTKKPEEVLKALENPFVQTGIKATREQVEKEKTLRPSGTQGMSDKPKSVSEQIANADMAGKEELLKKYGLYRDPRPRSDNRRIGR